jgi:small subunit ribosomal protein S9
MMADEPTPDETPEASESSEQQGPPAPEARGSEQPVASEEPAATEPLAEEEPAATEPVAEAPASPVAEGEPPVEAAVEQPVAEGASAEEPSASEQEPATDGEIAAEEPVAAQSPSDEEELEEEEEELAPRVKPSVPGAHLEVDIVPEGVDPLGRDEPEDPYAIEEEPQAEEQVREEEVLSEPISTAAIDLAADARYQATGKRKTAVARVILRPGSGVYRINGRTLEEHFPRETLRRNIRQPLETVGYQERMDVVARLHGGGVSAQAGALRHGVSRALLEADPNLRGELKRRGFLTRDSRAKERKKAGLKKARKRPQFSKR